jgi:large subunit ribosomal protein L15
MQLHSFSPRTKRTKNEPVGRGGRRGKTSGHGHKGQSSRAGHKIRPEARDLIKKIPKLRGHGKNRSRTVRTNRISVTPVSVAAIEMNYKAGETISPASLVAKGLVRRTKGRAPAVKILGADPFTKAFIVQHCAMSEVARKALIAAGGTYHA